MHVTDAGHTAAKPGAHARTRCQAGGKCCTRTLLMRVLHTHTAYPIGGTLKGIGYACGDLTRNPPDPELGSLSGGPSPGQLSGPVRTLRPGCWRLVCALGVDTQEVISIFNVVGAHHRSDQRHQTNYVSIGGVGGD